jgi:trans-aconitate 2-methyltransferase
MVAKARETLGDGIEVFQADLSELELDEPVDVVFSNAVLHWIMDHDGLFRRLYAALRPGGRMVVQCGGHGNVASLAKVIAEVGGDPRFATSLERVEPMWNFATPEETEAHLEAAGFIEVRCWLQPKPVTRDDAFDALRACALGPILDRLPEGDRGEFTRRVVERMGTPLRLDYVRLNIDARRPS